MGRYETLKYEVITREKHFEIRLYESYQTIAVYESDLTGQSGFGVLFNYISGNNDQNQKIAMTIPVINEFKTQNMTMEFVIPKKYQNDNVPKPMSHNLNIKTYDMHHAAVVVFSGRATKERIEKYTKLLKAFLYEKKIKHQDLIRLARYNSPFQLPVFRRNEIHIEIDLQN